MANIIVADGQYETVVINTTLVEVAGKLYYIKNTAVGDIDITYGVNVATLEPDDLGIFMFDGTIWSNLTPTILYTELNPIFDTVVVNTTLEANTLESKVATGTAPFTVASTTKVTNLNADLLDGISSGSFVRDTGNETIGGVKTFSSIPVVPSNPIADGDTGTVQGNNVYDFTRPRSVIDLNTAKNTNVTTNLSFSNTTTTTTIISSDGSNAIIPAVTTSKSGVMTTSDKTKLNGIATSANNYSLPLATNTVRGGIELYNNTDQSVASNSVTTTSGRTYGLQLNSANQGVINVPWVNTVYTHPGYATTNINTSGISIIDNISTNSTGHITAMGTRTLQDATGSQDGVMTKEAMTKLNTIATSANNYSLPVATASIGGVKTGTDITIDGSGNVSVNNNSHTHNGSTISALDGADITTGTISDARLPASISSNITGNAATATNSTQLGGATKETVLTDSDTKIPTSAAVKTYVDTQTGGNNRTVSWAASGMTAGTLAPILIADGYDQKAVGAVGYYGSNAIISIGVYQGFLRMSVLSPSGSQSNLTWSVGANTTLTEEAEITYPIR